MRIVLYPKDIPGHYERLEIKFDEGFFLDRFWSKNWERIKKIIKEEK